MNKNQKYLEMMSDIYAIFNKLNLKSFVWGGFAVDVLHGGFTREHGDLDCFAENLEENKEALQNILRDMGYLVNYLDDFWMLQIEKGEVRATFNSVRNICGIAHWHHAGPQGTVFFPYEWLDERPRVFYETPVYTCGLNLAYLIKTNVRLISADWEMRDKDKEDIKVLTELLAAHEINESEIKKRIWSHNPYWYAKGYAEYFLPMLLS